MATQHDIRRDLTIVHINIRHLYNNRTELQQLIEEKDPDIICLNETKLATKDKFSIQNYTIFRADLNRISGGVAILCKVSLPVKLHNNPRIFNNTQQLTIKFHIHGFPIYLTAIYLPPHSPFPDAFFTHLDSFHKSIILGDLNAYHRQFNDHDTNRAGTRLYNFLQNSNYNITITGPTRLPQCERQNTLTAPDKILMTTPLHNKILHTETLPPLYTDHCPILIKLRTPQWSPTHQFSPQTHYKYEMADWTIYKEHITANLPPPPYDISTTQQLLEADNLLLQVTCDARARAVPHRRKTRPYNRNKPLPPYIIQAIRIKRRAHRLYMRQRTEDNRRLYRQTQEDVKRAIDHYEHIKLIRFTNNLDHNKKENPKKFWQTIRKLKGNQHPSYPLKLNNEYIFSTADKLQTFQNHLANIFNIPMHPDFNVRHFDTINNEIGNNDYLYTPLQNAADDRDDHPLSSLISPQELIRTLEHTRSSAPGPDNIPYILLKNYPPNAIQLLTDLYNASFHLGVLPPRWKEANIILIPKANKDLTNPNNYRPISLTPTICKTLERILKRRIQIFLDDNDIIPPSQAGFRPGIDIMDQILKILTPLEIAYETGRTSILVSIDLQRAFDSVWHNGLRHKLTITGLPTRITRWLSDFIRDRTARVRILNQLSGPLPLRGGVPQGTVLSPLLYTIYVADIPQPTRPGVILGQFADDTICMATSNGIIVSQQRMNSSLTRITQWLQKWRLTVNTQKSQAIILKKRRPPTARQRDANAIRLHNTEINYSKFIKYLGITFSNKLNFSRHLISTKSKLTIPIKILYNLSGKPPSRPSTLPHTAMIIYKSIIRPSILYGSQILTRLTDHQFQSLESLERRLIRKCFNLPPNTNNQTVYRISKIKPLSEYIHRKHKKYVDKALRKPFTLDLFQNLPPNLNLTITCLLRQHQQYLHRPP